MSNEYCYYRYKFAHNEECEAVKKYIETVSQEVPKIMAQFDDFLDSYNVISAAHIIATDSADSYQPDFVVNHVKLFDNLVSTIAHWEETLVIDAAFCAYNTYCYYDKFTFLDCRAKSSHSATASR